MTEQLYDRTGFGAARFKTKSESSINTSNKDLLSTTIGEASSAIFLLRDYSRFGLEERICYHFDLIVEAKGGKCDEDLNMGLHTNSNSNITCGIRSVLELAPTVASHRLSRRQKRYLRMRLRELNAAAENVHGESAVLCHQPHELPLRCNPSTKVLFGYEKTRIAFCIDASASLTSTFGINGCRFDNNNLCPLDRLPEMARIFFKSLIEPISTTSMSEVIRPLIFVTVLAVFPGGPISETNLLVRDFKVRDAESANLLINKIECWTRSEVECGISERLIRRKPTWSIPIYSSNLRHILEAADYAINVLSSEARPVIVIATDGRSISCDGIVDIFVDVNRIDKPIHVLDLSQKETHMMKDDTESSKHEINFLTYDPGGNMDFPLYLTDDSEALFRICRATGGCFLDFCLLSEAATSTAGQQQTTDDLQISHTFKRRFLKMNGLQWLTLFSLSPISPTFYSLWGKLVPPSYLQKQINASILEVAAASALEKGGISSNSPSDTLFDSLRNRQVSVRQSNAIEVAATVLGRKQNTQTRTTFSTYVISPVRIKALMLTRIKEGYRAKQYGLSTHDADKVFIQFMLPIDSGTVSYYELSYTALSSDHHMVGSAHIKIELSGDPSFIQAVKNDFLHQPLQVPEKRSYTVRQKRSARLCQVFREIRQGDILQSYLKPPQPQIWSNILANPGSNFVKRLGKLEYVQRKRHFQADKFDVVCTGPIPYNIDDNFFSGFMMNQDGRQELIDSVTEWCSQTIAKGSKFLKRLPASNFTTNYCVVEIVECSKASQLFTITVEFFGGIDPIEHFQTIYSLKGIINGNKYVEVLEKQMAPFLIGNKHNTLLNSDVQIQFHHASWDLVKDPELLSLLSKRRTEIGGFRLLESRDNYALFAKLESKSPGHPGDLVQYEIAVLNNKVVIDLHMESESGVFNPYYMSGGARSHFGRMVNALRRRDQECGRALRSRTNLLRVFDAQGLDEQSEDHLSSVTRILAYSSRVTRNLRYFRLLEDANNILVQLTSDSLLSKASGVKCSKLKIDSNTLIHDGKPGLWFIIQYDRQTMSIAHLCIDNEVQNVDNFQAFRELTFFTIGISDLYSKRDDLADDDSAESHISEYLCVSEFADCFELEQVKNFTLSAYIALRQSSSPGEAKINGTDFDEFNEVIQNLQFIEVSSVHVEGTQLDAYSEDSKLLRSIQKILSPVPGDNYHFYYSGNLVDIFEGHENESHGSSDDISTNAATSKVGEHMISRDDLSVSIGSNTDQNEPVHQPIFVKFHLDGEIASMNDLNGISKSSILSVTVSMFKSYKDREKLPSSHQRFALEISSLLKSYVAEQTLEKLRSSNYSENSLQLVRKCMAKISSVISLVIEIYFFISIRDMMMPAAAPAGGESEVLSGFLVLENEIMNNGSFILQPLSDGVYFVSSIVGEKLSLDFWCLLKLQKVNGTVASQIYHPAGEHIAMTTLSHIHDVVCSCIHITNQQLLLRSLHRTRTVSKLLIPNPEPVGESVVSDYTDDKFFPGIFQCPIVFRKLFNLYHRAATNPEKVARTLEATVLHNFAVSNRSGIFVYKDETGEIFYMKIVPIRSGIDSEGMVELLVYGVKNPGPSVTEQLRILLQRRLLLIAVEMFSSVLTKNQYFKWKQADLLFLRSFSSEWEKLQTEKTDKDDHCFYYKFPDGVTDPFMVLLLFRQNLCGSTFFHRLNDIGLDGSTPSPSIKTRDILTSGGTSLKMNQHEFSVYYNNAQTKLDPAFQAVSTLTEKGADYCRKAGVGIAIVEFTLLDGNGDSADQLCFATNANETFSDFEVPIGELRLQKYANLPRNNSSDSAYIRIKIIDTALNKKVLHEWISLTLNQAIVTWVTERLFERSFHCLLRPFKERKSAVYSTLNKNLKQEGHVDALYPGIFAIKSIFESSYDLPHPAITRVDKSGVIRSSSVASLTVDLLEKSILAPLMESKMLTVADDDGSPKRLLEKVESSIRVIRLSRSEKPHIVHFKRNFLDPQNILVSLTSENKTDKVIEDTPIDCPEYICLCVLSERNCNIKSIDSQLRLYREIIIHDGISEKSESIKLLESIKERSQEAFMRSFAFILSVKRNARRLWMYNWNPQLAASVQKIVHEVETLKLVDTQRASRSLQRQSLGILSPFSTGCVETKSNSSTKKQHSQNAVKCADSSAERSDKKTSKIEISSTGPRRRIRRPTMIRRPKLIGKSIEGAAMQAMAASRKRASTNQFKKNYTPKGTKLPTRPSLNRKSCNGRVNSIGKDDSSLTHSRDEAKDETLSLVTNDFTSFCSIPHENMDRHSSIQTKARLKLADVWFPQNPMQMIPVSVANFLISRAPKSWNDVCTLPPLPGGVIDVFIPALARYLVAVTPSLDLLPISSPSNLPLKNINSMLLCTAIRNVHSTKCCAIIKISVADSNTLVRSEGWIVNLRRRRKLPQKPKRHGRVVSAFTIEKDAAGMDKLLADVHYTLVLESLLFDFSASMVERAVRLLDKKICFDDLVPNVVKLMTRHPYERQKRCDNLNYRVFEATVVLKSYKDRLIDMFDANILFTRLCIEAENREMLKCGNALCLKPISVKGSHSTCFITLHPNDTAKMKLVILCRTQGIDLADFMFRERSIIGIHILDNIAEIAGGLALKELHFVAESLLKDSLWTTFSSRKSPTFSIKAQKLYELLNLVYCRPLVQLYNYGVAKHEQVPTEVAFLFTEESGIDWLSCCSVMKQTEFFLPHFSIEDNTKGVINNLFYIERYDVFLMLVIRRDSSLSSADVIEKKKNPEKYQFIYDSIVGFILHFVWHKL